MNDPIIEPIAPRLSAARRRLCVGCLLGALALAAPGPPATAQETPPAGTLAVPLPPARLRPALPAVGLSVLTGPRVRAATPVGGVYDFGRADALDTPRVQQTFFLRNDAKTPRTLERLAPSCHCTSAVVGTAGAALPTLAPGQRATVRVTVDLAGHPPGPLTKFVTVYVHGDPRPAATLTVTGTLLPSLTFTPALLDFGQTPVGEERTATLTATLDARLAPGGVLPPLVCSNPAVRIAAAPAVLTGPTPGAGGDAPRMLTVTYTLALHDAPMGAVTGTVSFVPEETARRVGPAPLPFAARSAALTSGEVLLSGLVTGDLAPSPQTLAFGPVPLRRGAIRQVLLTGRTPAAVEGLRVASASRWLSARVLDPGGTAPDDPTPTRVLQVTLSPDAPPGVLQTQIKVVLAGGHRLLLPVSAYITPTPQP